MKNYFIIAAILLAGWLLISRPMSRAEAARSSRVRFTNSVISLLCAGVAVWFAWWVLSTRCGGAC
jgi:hypothetical protein